MHEGLGVPLNALAVTLAVVLVYGLLFFAGAAALNALVSGCVVMAGFSYVFPVLVLMIGGRKRLPANRPFKLNEGLAWVVNIIGVVYTLVTTVLFCLPPMGPSVENGAMSGLI